jgi:exosortase K
MRNRLNYIAQLVVVLGGALSMKFYYSAASVNQLRWILTPTTLLVEFITGRHFTFESHAGYMSSDHTFLIAASCAGVNFSITAFLMLTLRQLWQNRLTEKHHAHWRQWTFLPFAAGVAYATTLIANTSRISIALQIQQTSFKVAWLDAEQLHRLEGIVVYFGFLLLLFVLVERVGSEREVGRVARRFSLLRASFFPVLIYYLMTLGLPLANGAYGQRSFWEHAVFVVLAPIAIVLLIGGLEAASRRMRRSYSVPSAVADGSRNALSQS